MKREWDFIWVCCWRRGWVEVDNAYCAWLRGRKVVGGAGGLRTGGGIGWDGGCRVFCTVKRERWGDRG